MPAIMTSHIATNEAAMPSHLCPGILIHGMDVVLSPGIAGKTQVGSKISLVLDPRVEPFELSVRIKLTTRDLSLLFEKEQFEETGP